MVSQGHAVARFVSKQRARYERFGAGTKGFALTAERLDRSGRVMIRLACTVPAALAFLEANNLCDCADSMTSSEYSDVKQLYKFAIAYDSFTEISKACEQLITAGQSGRLLQ